MAVVSMLPVLLLLLFLLQRRRAPVLTLLSVLPAAAEGKQVYAQTTFLRTCTKQYTTCLSSAGSSWG